MCAGNRIRKVCNRWCLHKNWISSKLHRREETTGSVCDEDSSSSLSYHKKSLTFFKALPGEETEEGVCFQWVLKVVGATIDGFLR